MKLKLSLLASILLMSFPSFADDVCETTPEGATVTYLKANTIGSQTDYAQIGDTKSYIKGRPDNYFVHNHNGLPIIEANGCVYQNPVLEKGALAGILVTTPQYFKKNYGNKYTGTGGLEIQDLAMLAEDKSIVAGLKQYVGKKVDKELLKDIIRDVVVDMRDKNQPVVDVFAPKQDVTNGNLVILVDRAVVGDVIVRGNQYYDTDTIRRYLSAGKGEYIYSDDLARDLRWINTNPYRNVDVVFKPGEKPGTTDVVLETKDMYPARVFGGVDNYGSSATNENQFNIGFSYGNLFGKDHEIIYNFISSFDFANFNAHVLQYNIPFEWRHKLALTATYSTSEPKSTNALFAQSGENITLNAEYEVPLYNFGLRGFTHDYKIGLDYKRISSTTEFGGTTVFDSPVEVAQGYLTYDVSRTTNNSLNLGSVTVVVSPGDITSENNDIAFDANVIGAESKYAYVKGLYDGNFTEDNYGIGFRALLRGQYAKEKLLSSEQIAIDGPGAVRGFGSNTIRKDRGFLATLEVSSPYVPVLDEYLGTKLRDRVQAFVFYDQGTGIDEQPYAAGVTNGQTTLQSIGVGTRFGIGRSLNGVVEYGYEVGGDAENNGRDQHLQFRLNTSY
jgi:hemolysin activation/secretion protein